jgi:protein-tyrosine kinase
MIKSFVSSYPDQLHSLGWSLFPTQATEASRVIQFTSARFGEGVTTVTLALASSLARLFGPDSTLVIEANLRQPSFSKILGRGGHSSIIGALQDQDKSLESVITLPDYGFSIIPAGITAPIKDYQGPEMYLEKMGNVLEKMRNHYAYILIDCPPVVPYLDSDIISAFVDGLVIVVEANSTRAEVLNFAIRRLKSVDAPIVGLILNKRVFYIPKWLYKFL